MLCHLLQTVLKFFNCNTHIIHNFRAEIQGTGKRGEVSVHNF